MNFNLDNHPLTESELYVNDPHIVNPNEMTDQGTYCESNDIYQKLLTGKTRADGGVLPNDNIRVYAPLNLNAMNIVAQFQRLYDLLGYPNDENESAYSYSVDRLISLLEIYDHVWMTKETKSHEVENAAGNSKHGIDLAKQMIKCLEENDGTAECFPYEQIDAIREKFQLALE